MTNEEALEKLATEYIEQGNLQSLDEISQEIYGTTYRSLSLWGKEKIASMIGVKTTTEEESDLAAKLASEKQRTAELENQLQEAWDQIEFLEVENFDLEMENLNMKNRRSK